MLTEGNLPSVDDIRNRVDSLGKLKYMNALRYQYLICGRVSEVCGNYAPIGTDAHIVEFEGEEAILFPVRTAKRNGKIRPVALPLKYEPWARALVGWFEYILFDGLSYPIEKYRPGKYLDWIDAHWNPMCTHALRHIRALQDLLCFYGFDGLDLAIYGGRSSQSVESRLPGIAWIPLGS